MSLNRSDLENPYDRQIQPLPCCPISRVFGPGKWVFLLLWRMPQLTIGHLAFTELDLH